MTLRADSVFIQSVRSIPSPLSHAFSDPFQSISICQTSTMEATGTTSGSTYAVRSHLPQIETSVQQQRQAQRYREIERNADRAEIHAVGRRLAERTAREQLAVIRETDEMSVHRTVHAPNRRRPSRTESDRTARSRRRSEPETALPQQRPREATAPACAMFSILAISFSHSVSTCLSWLKIKAGG